jgi:putative ATPase
MDDFFEKDPENRPLTASLSYKSGLVEQQGGFDHRPLPERMRPSDFQGYLGQESLTGEKAPLMKLIKAERVPSMMLWGPPGSGKTTLAQLIAGEVQADFVTMSAVTSSVRDVRQVVDSAKANLRYQRRTILFIDEIHRFNKSQQDAFLPHVESGIITLIGATTENPSFSVIGPLLSRCRVFVLKPLDEDDLVKLLEQGMKQLNEDRKEEEPELGAEEDALRAIARLSDGDARRALGLLELAASVKYASEEASSITFDDISAVSQRTLVYDKSGEEHFNLISALHKTLRSSDPHGAIYWVGRMLAAGEDPRYVARRLIRFASEDIGLAEPNALLLASEALRSYESLGPPEGELALAQAAAYLALCPKSNSVYAAYNEVMAEIKKSGSLPVPMHLRNAPTKLMKDVGYNKGYTYDHDGEGNFVPKQGLPDDLAGRKYYRPSENGTEKKLKERLDHWDKLRDEAMKKDEG